MRTSRAIAQSYAWMVKNPNAPADHRSHGQVDDAGTAPSALASLCIVHVRFRRSAHSFSLADLPFVFGLVFATGDGFVLGAIVGHLVVLGLIRRLELVKLLFNLAQLALAATLAAAI